MSYSPGTNGNQVSYQWRKDGVNISGATANGYQIDNASANDTGSYDVLVTNSCGGEFSTPAIVTVGSYSLNLMSQNFGASGSPGSVNVTSTGAGCAWTAVSNSSFITVTSGAAGLGNGTVGFTVAANTGPNQRTGTMTIARHVFTVTQDGLNSVTQSLRLLNFSSGSNSSSVNVTATAGCARLPLA